MGRRHWRGSVAAALEGTGGSVAARVQSVDSKPAGMTVNCVSGVSVHVYNDS